MKKREVNFNWVGIIVTLIIFNCTFSLFGQYTSPTNNTVDSLIDVSNTNISSFEKTKIYNRLTDIFSSSSTDTAWLYNHRAELSYANYIKEEEEGTELNTNLLGEILFAKGCLFYSNSLYDSSELSFVSALEIISDDNQLKGTVLGHLSRLYQRNGLNELFLETTKQALAIQESISDRTGMVYSMVAIGDYYARISKMDSCNNYYLKALSSARIANDQRALAFCLTQIGHINQKCGSLQEATSNFYEALKIQEEQGFNQGAMYNLIAIGVLHYQQDDFEKALYLFDKATVLNRGINSKMIEYRLKYHLAMVAYHKQEYSLSIKFFEEYITYAKSKSLLAIALNSLAMVHHKLGDNTKALELLQRSENIGIEISLPEHKAERQLSFGKIFLDMGRIDLAEKHFKEAFQIAHNNIGFPRLIVETCNYLIDLYDKKGNYKEALSYSKVSDENKEKITVLASKASIAQKAIEEELSQREHELSESEERASTLYVDQLFKNSVILISWISFFLLIAIVVLLGFNYVKKRNKKEASFRMQILQNLEKISSLESNLNTLLVEGNNFQGEINLEVLNKHLENPISSRELEVLQELSKAKSNKEIASTLFISVNTVRAHLKSIFKKLNVNNRTQAIKKAGNIRKI